MGNRWIENRKHKPIHMQLIFLNYSFYFCTRFVICCALQITDSKGTEYRFSDYSIRGVGKNSRILTIGRDDYSVLGILDYTINSHADV